LIGPASVWYNWQTYVAQKSVRMNGDALIYRTLLQDDLDGVRTHMLDECRRIPGTIRHPVNALIESGGKRLRPALVLLSSYLCNADRRQAVITAAAVEMLHTATLIHDDLIDEAAVRRGVGTLNAAWSPMVTVLAGDVVFSLAAKLIARGGSTTLMGRFATTLETICLGEIGQMFERNGDLPSVESYYRRIYAKTASLFSLCTEAGPVLAGCSARRVARGRRLGKLLGQAFQITDDVLDLMGATAELGKPVGSDLSQGLATLPVLIYEREHPADGRLRAVLARTSDRDTLHDLMADIRVSHAPQQAMAVAEGHAAEALHLIGEHPETPYRRALEEIAHFAVRRQY
jgi:geranylgeranyl pyrophosphate synthase